MAGGKHADETEEQRQKEGRFHYDVGPVRGGQYRGPAGSTRLTESQIRGWTH
jgi:hypothetical protein